MTSKKTFLFTLIFALLAFVQGALARQVSLSTDMDFGNNQTGYYYVNMPVDDTDTLRLENTALTFKVYDDGGKHGGYAPMDHYGSMLLQAPEGYVFEVTGRILEFDLDYFGIYDGRNQYDRALYEWSIDGPYDETVDDIGTYPTTINKMFIDFSTQSDESYAGFELSVRMKPNLHIHNVTVEQQLGGTWTVDEGGNTAVYTRDVTLTFAPEANRVVTSIKVIKADDASTEIELRKLDDTHYRFTMPDYDVTVVPGAYDWKWISGNTICRLDNEGVFTVSPVPGEDGAMADYDNPSNRPWSNVFSNVTSVVVKNGVTTIGKYAFHSGNFTSASLPEGLQSIHDHAFRYCNRLTSINIPYTVRSVAAGAFYACFGLGHIYTYAQAEGISWGVDPWDFIRDPDGVNPGPFTVMHVFSSQLQAYQSKHGSLNVTFVGDLPVSGNWTDEGHYADSFSQQNGNTITITNEAEMARLAYMVNVARNTYTHYTFKLARDLNMQSHNWSPIGTGNFTYQNNLAPFMGTFDGQGHTINGIVVNRGGSNYNGLFGYVGGLSGYDAYGEVKNVSLKQSSIAGGNYTGGLVGYLRYGKVTNCYTDASVSGSRYVGGLVGAMEGHSTNNIKASVTKSLYMGSEVNGSQDARAVVGRCESNADYCTIRAYYTNKNVSTKTVNDIYAVKVLDDSSEDITVTFDGNGVVAYGADTYAATDGSAKFTVRATDLYKPLANVTVNGNDFATDAGTYTFETLADADICRINATVGSGLRGSGTEAEPYLISNVDEWNLFAELVAGGATFSGKFVRVDDHIDDIGVMVGESESLSFQGTFDGGAPNYLLTFDINSTADYAAPFRFVKNATLKNIWTNGTFNVGKHGSSLVGKTFGNTRIENVYARSTVAVSSSRNSDRYIGGIVGHGGNSVLTLKGVLFEGSLTSAGEYTGGLLGWADGMTLNLDNCTFKGVFSGNGAFHPIATRVAYAPMRGTITNTFFTVLPRNIDNGHIAVAAIRVYYKNPAEALPTGAVTATDAMGRSCYYYDDAPEGLHIDYDKERGTAGYYYVNMQFDNLDQQLVLGKNVTSFTVYDDGGKLGYRSCGGESKLKLIAPKDKILEIGGRVEQLDPWDDFFSVDDDAGHNLFRFGDLDEQQVGEAPYEAVIPSATSAGHVLFVSFEPDIYDVAGFELEVTLQDDGNLHFGAVTIVNNGRDSAYIDGAYIYDDETVVPQAYGVDTVVFDREFKVDAFSTIMLPFEREMGTGIDLAKVSGAEFYGFSEMKYEDGKWTAGATQVTGSLEANTPYLVKPTAKRITFGGKMVIRTTGIGGNRKTVRDGWEFRGTYKRFVFGDSSEILGSAYGFVAKDTVLSGKQFSAGQFVKAGPRAYIQPMRAYLVHVGDNSTAKNVGGFGEFGELPETIELKIMDENGNVTETATLNTRTGEVKRDRWFDLQGRKLNGKPSDRGKYLHNGKVEVVK